MSSEFYRAIPHDFGFSKMVNHIIDRNDKVKAKLEQLADLCDIKVADELMTGSAGGENELDMLYRRLNCNIAGISRADPVFKQISEYLRVTHAPTHMQYSLTLLDIYRVSREQPDFMDELGNHLLLWHGSRLTNWVGILS